MSAQFTQMVKNAMIEELEQLHKEVRALIDPLADRALWLKPVEPGNSVGHLVLHLTGNLNHFIGAQLGQTGYVRQRDREFTEAAPPPRRQLMADFDDAVDLFRRVVSGLSEEQLLAPYPEAKFGITIKALLHFLAHFALHRGQMTYLVRLGQKGT